MTTGSTSGVRRLLVLDAGTLEGMDPTRFGLTADEVTTDRLSVTAYLIEHEKGTLIWDSGAVPDADWTPTGEPVTHEVRLPEGAERRLTLRRRIASQLEDSGVATADVTHLALSHHHYDHTANASLFERATWLVRRSERDTMFGSVPAPLSRPTDYTTLRDRPTILIDAARHDVFGDESVVLIAATGHTPGHQVLLVRLPETGPVLLSGDLYHYPQERTLDRVPTFETDAAATRRARVTVDVVLAEVGVELWIGHDAIATDSRRMAPASYG